MLETFDQHVGSAVKAGLPSTLIALLSSSGRHGLFAGLAKTFAYLGAKLAALAPICPFDQEPMMPALRARGSAFPSTLGTKAKIRVDTQHTRQACGQLTTFLTGLRVIVVMSTAVTRWAIGSHQPHRFTDLLTPNAWSRSFATPAYRVRIKSRYREPGIVTTASAETALE